MTRELIRRAARRPSPLRATLAGALTLAIAGLTLNGLLPGHPAAWQPLLGLSPQWSRRSAEGSP